jgi:hypothetical protein
LAILDLQFFETKFLEEIILRYLQVAQFKDDFVDARRARADVLKNARNRRRVQDLNSETQP